MFHRKFLQNVMRLPHVAFRDEFFSQAGPFRQFHLTSPVLRTALLHSTDPQGPVRDASPNGIPGGDQTRDLHVESGLLHRCCSDSFQPLADKRLRPNARSVCFHRQPGLYQRVQSEYIQCATTINSSRLHTKLSFKVIQ